MELRVTMPTAYERNVKYVKKNPQKVKAWKRDSHLRKTYGITLEDYNYMVTEQNGMCAICKKHVDKGLCVDHNHLTGKIRGLLCRTCNAGLGNFYEDLNLFTEAQSYLRKWC